MKNKGIIIGVIAVIIIVIGGLLLFLSKKDSGITSTITLDINPSIELEIKNGKIIRASALNDDANDIISGIEGKTLEDSFDIIIQNAKEHNFVEDGNITIILGMDNNDKKIEEYLNEACNKNALNANIIVPEITEEAKNEAKLHGLTAAKAAYILDIVSDNENLHFENMINKSSGELDEMKQTGRYCDEGYTLSGEFCEKVVREEKAKEGKTCPEGYEDINGKCYLKTDTTNEPYCKNGLELKNGKCVGTEKVSANGKCSTGTYNSSTKKCEVLTYVSEGTKSCKGEDDYLLDNGKCAYPHMGAHFDDPEGEIDPANECCCGDTWVANSSTPGRGWCYSMPNGNYDAIISCPSGSNYTTGDKGAGCYKADTSEPTFSCSSGKLDGSSCVVEASKNPEYKLSCSGSSELYKDRTCIDYSSTKDYIIGYVCEEEAKLVNGRCLYYEVTEAKTK